MAGDRVVILNKIFDDLTKCAIEIIGYSESGFDYEFLTRRCDILELMDIFYNIMEFNKCQRERYEEEMKRREKELKNKDKTPWRP